MSIHDLGTNPREALRELEQRARKRFGQHFLRDTGVVQRIVRAARVAPGDHVVEIGPGLGILTGALLNAGADLIVVELDRDLAAYLRSKVPDLRVVEADAVKVDWSELCDGERHKVVANLPYNVGTTVSMQLLRLPSLFSSVTVMLQKEVVQRMGAGPGSKTYGALSVQVQVRAATTFITQVEPGHFVPPPKVHSAVIRLDVFDEPQVGAVTPVQFDKVVRAAFSQRRKTLLNSVGATYGREQAREALADAGVDPGARADAIDVDAYRRLAAALYA